MYMYLQHTVHQDIFESWIFCEESPYECVLFLHYVLFHYLKDISFLWRLIIFLFSLISRLPTQQNLTHMKISRYTVNVNVASNHDYP